MPQEPQQPGLIGSHAEYAKGAIESAIGDLTGSQPWKSSGEQDKASATAAMKKAGEQREEGKGYGKAEELAGKISGCEGMRKEGAASAKE
ncbi:csbD-like domain-containing protein [Ophiocordyceps camponoti-floridani]|uniref:CsbD-like domain-containing protein n=1 Tax=Ophiocordyceps camponoti-floridani TaxID=2030778 RepID=A0A8H4VDQ7_9HYPO|nr:csbD-like domain-containing protein [Ophiocordyceps camponoti-floridani]